MGEVVPARTLPTLHPIPSHCASIVVISTLRVNQVGAGQRGIITYSEAKAAFRRPILPFPGELLLYQRFVAPVTTSCNKIAMRPYSLTRCKVDKYPYCTCKYPCYIQSTKFYDLPAPEDNSIM